MRKIAIFASGSGTNAENIIRHFFVSKVAKVDLILTENKDAFVLSRAQRIGVSAHIFTLEELRSGVVKDLILRRGVDFIVLAGFLKMIPLNLIQAYPDKILNIHPALLPNFGGKGMYGVNVHKAVIDAGEGESGISIHLVNEHYDKGDIIFQARCPVLPNDNPETLAERIHALEYEFYPIVIERLVSSLK
jgi:phosphoribosylglycinamide formyltransferase-1